MARYLVTQPPGAPIPHVGFVKQGESFFAPAGYQPSRTFLPLDEEAQAELERVHGIRKPIAAAPTSSEAPRVERGVSLSQLAKAELEARRGTEIASSGIVAKDEPRPAPVERRPTSTNKRRAADG